MRAVTDNIFVIPRLFTNIYVIDTGSGLALVDTHFSPAVITTLEKEFALHGFQLNQITNILITHAHFDHIGGLAALQNRINVRTIAHRREAPIIRGEQPAISAPRDELKGVDWVISHFLTNSATPARVDVEMKEGDEVLLGVKVVELPGHSYGQIGFWWQEKRLLIGGDVVMNLPWGLSVPTRAASPDWVAVKQSIRKVAEMNLDILCVGHGNPIIGGAAAKVQALSQKIGT